MMKKLEKALIKINQLNIRGSKNKIMQFALEAENLAPSTDKQN
jgi:hypothetical protein